MHEKYRFKRLKMRFLENLTPDYLNLNFEENEIFILEKNIFKVNKIIADGCLLKR
jgi:hypothetical protein